MEQELRLQPFLKWAGGKRQLLSSIRAYLPKQFATYYEPFVGAGALLFDIRPEKAVINDLNSELINCYRIIKENLDELLIDLAKHCNDVDYYYQIRDLDRQPQFNGMSAVERASRIIYLNKTCYNGLFRVNSEGQYNVPFGRYKNPRIVDEGLLRSISSYLNQNDIKILNTDFAEATGEAQAGDFIYFDPPYDPVSNTASFTGYNLSGFGREEQVRLRDHFKTLDQKGCFVLLSNSATEFIYELYRNYKIVTVTANRAINSKADGRGKVAEVLIMNY
ncbi:MAG TPA: DNA adenine methylase [Bacillota bacterium]|jgi:DNA adenine methylase|nr:DNA adenine methylase [Bacillota bacterium]HOL09027.1 DNA adenine methylase [Bacillota bacterium]HPO96702.1 DNA adenine methylase [Bacillota bacterium]